MEPIINLGFAIVILGITLSLAFSYLSGPMSLLRRSGAYRAVGRVGRALLRGLASMVGLLIRRRRPRIRRGHTRAPIGYFR